MTHYTITRRNPGGREPPLVVRLRNQAQTLLEMQVAMKLGYGVALGDLLDSIEQTMHEAADVIEAAERNAGSGERDRAPGGWGEIWDPLGRFRQEGG